MFERVTLVYGVNLALLSCCSVSAQAQTVPAPTAYTVTVTNSIFGSPQVMKIHRLGSKALIDMVSLEKAADPQASHTRSLYDLDKHRNLSWSWPDSSAGCSTGTFSGDWGDPFAGDADVTGQGATQVGSDTIHGFPAKILESSTPTVKIKAWIDTKYGMILKAQMSQAGSELKTVIEVTDVNLTPPPPSLFAIPASCAATAAAPPPPTEAEQIAALTGGNPRDFVKAIYGPGSKTSCNVLFRVVKAGTMEPIASGIQVAADLKVTSEPTPSYVFGVGEAGHATFSGGAIHEILSQTHNGVFRIDHAPAQFELVTDFGTAGSSDSNVYLQCFAPQTVLLLVVKNPAKLSDGAELLWVKSGQYATALH
jgi:hypothetical protein